MYGELPEIQTSTGETINGFPVQILRPAKTAVLRLPTNPEMSGYLNQQKTLYRDLGRRKGQSESVPNRLFAVWCGCIEGDGAAVGRVRRLCCGAQPTGT